MNITHESQSQCSSLLVVLANQTPEALVILDANLNVVLFNYIAEKLFICSEPKVVGMSFKSVCELSGIDYFIDLYSSQFNAILPLNISSLIHNRKMIWQTQSIEDNGYVFHILKTINLSEKDNLNEIYQLETLIENMPCNVYWMDNECKMGGCNQNVLTMLNMTREQFKGKTYEELSIICHWPDGLANKLKNDDRFVLSTGQSITGIEDPPIPHANGTYSQFLTSRVPLKNKDGDIVGVAGISTEITALKEARKKTEEAIVAMADAEAAALVSKVKAENEEEMRKTVMVLVGDIVHDLRTPIATIRTVATILASIFPILLDIIKEAESLGAEKINLLSKKKLTYLKDNTPIESLHSAVSMMDDFINTTLVELSNAQKTDMMVLNHEDLIKCSSRRILENTLDAYPLPDNIKVHLNISYDFFLMGNSILIMKILFNLIKNAIEQISLNGNGDITITTEDAGDKNVLRIKDTGGGAPPEVIANLFKGYFTTKKNGTGIGLSYCKKTMENFGGNLICHSIFGDYMEFILSFPKIDNE